MSICVFLFTNQAEKIDRLSSFVGFIKIPYEYGVVDKGRLTYESSLHCIPWLLFSLLLNTVWLVGTAVERAVATRDGMRHSTVPVSKVSHG